MNSKFLLLPTALMVAGHSAAEAKGKKSDQRPNILIILADDLGYSDLGCYGSEIHTPNLDKLAKQGVRFNHFYNTSRSCPTRASLLTGLYQHQAGIGRMTFDDHLPGYRGTLSRNAVTIAEVLKESGYATSMVGKWHIAETPLRKDQREWLAHHVYHETYSDLCHYPVNRGFDTHYGTIYGVVDYFDPFSLVEGEVPVKEVPDGYYITQALSDRAVKEVWGNTHVAPQAVVLESRSNMQNFVPSVIGMGAKDAVYLLESKGLKVNLVGVGKVKSQSIANGTIVKKGQTVTLTLK